MDYLRSSHVFFSNLLDFLKDILILALFYREPNLRMISFASRKVIMQNKIEMWRMLLLLSDG